MSLPYYKFHPADDIGNYQLQTLPHDALGVWYLLRICHLWQHGGYMPDDPTYIAPLLKLSVDQWNSHKIEYLKRGLIQVVDGHINIGDMRDKWIKAKMYTDMQSEKRLEAIRVKKERDILKKKKKTK